VFPAPTVTAFSPVAAQLRGIFLLVIGFGSLPAFMRRRMMMMTVVMVPRMLAPPFAECKSRHQCQERDQGNRSENDQDIPRSRIHFFPRNREAVERHLLSE
jgi:hypothetical protein